MAIPEEGSGQDQGLPTRGPATSPPAQQSGVGYRTVFIPEIGKYVLETYDIATGEVLGRDIYSGTTSGSGGGAAVGPDHFFDVSPVDQFNMDYTQQKFAADEKYRQAQLALDTAMKTGDLELARQAQADSNYWQGVSADLQSKQLGTTGRGQDIDIWKQQSDDARIRELTGQANQTGQFGAETTRAVGMGDLALRQNELIAKMASDPRQLNSLFFMQRGIAPDWNNLLNGGAPGIGQAMAPQNPMTAYQGGTAAPTFGGAPSQGLPPPPPQMQQQAADYGPPPRLTTSGGGSAPITSANPPPQSTPGPGAQPVTDGYWISPQGTVVKKMAVGGVHTGPAIVGDNPNGGYSGREEIVNPVISPDGRPAIQVQPVNPDGLRAQAEKRMQQLGWTPPGQAMRPMPIDPQPAQRQQMNPMLQRFRGGLQATGAQYPPGWTPQRAMQRAADFGVGQSGYTDMSGFNQKAYLENKLQAAQGAFKQLPAFGAGTDNSAVYSQNGMANQWMPSSSNAHVGADAPKAIQMLKDYGAPVSPAVLAASTGQSLGIANTPAAMAARGLGATPSLQTLRQMDPNERLNYEGYVQGVGGIPFDSLIDYLQKLSGGFGRAQRSGRLA